MQKEIERQRDPVKSKRNDLIDESKLSAPQRKALEMARAKGVPMQRKLEDLVPDLGLTQKEADEFGRILEEIREESRRESRNS